MRVFVGVILFVGCSRAETTRPAVAAARAVHGTVPASCSGANPHNFQEPGLQPARPTVVGTYEVGEGQPGTATLVQIIVRSNGSVCAAQTLQFSGFVYDVAAANDVLLWQFEPARTKGRAVDVNMLLAVRRKPAA